MLRESILHTWSLWFEVLRLPFKSQVTLFALPLMIKMFVPDVKTASPALI